VRLQTKVTTSVGALIGLASLSVSSVAVWMSLEQNIKQSEQNLDRLADVILESEDPVSTALFEGSTRELTALYVDQFGIESYLQENAGELGAGNQISRVIELPNSESITLAVSTEAAFAGANATVAPLAAITLLVILLATLITHLILRHDISAINETIQRARTIAQGGERKLATLRGSWEVETLTDSLAKMIHSLDNNEKALQKFLSDASHELKTPLTVVRGYLDILSGPSVSVEVRQSAEKALRQSIRMQRIIDDLLELAEVRGSESSQNLEVDLSTLVNNAIEDLSSLDSGHQIEVEIQEMVKIQGNPEQIEKLLANLVGNLHNHVPSGSKVSVKLNSDGQHVNLLVEDSGPGFQEGVLTAEGKPVRFRKGDSPKRGSTGLGLSLIFEVVANHRGEVSIGRSSLGGALVEIRFPG
jgi:signal transduction histidine kinase